MATRYAIEAYVVVLAVAISNLFMLLNPLVLPFALIYYTCCYGRYYVRMDIRIPRSGSADMRSCMETSIHVCLRPTLRE